MRKTNTNIKRIAFIKQLLKYAILVQVVILLLFVILFYQSKPINIKSCKSEQIVVHDKEYKRVYRENICQIYFNETRYDYPNLGITGKYTAKELYETMQLGDHLDLTYAKRYGILGEYNLIIDARDEANVYIDMDLYNSQKEKAFITTLIFFSITELLFLSCIILSIFFNRKKLKL